MKDSILLLLTALLVAVVSWAFWHFAGADGFAVLNLLALVALAADNLRLRRRLKRRL